MGTSLLESQALDDLAALLYNFLPASGNRSLSFPVAAQQAGVSDLWVHVGSKGPAILGLLGTTYTERRSRFCELILAVVRLSITWRRSKGLPLRRDEIECLNQILLRLQFKVPDLHDRAFLAGLAAAKSATEATRPAQPVETARLEQVNRDLVDITQLPPSPRGFAFEKFLNELFDLFRLAPRGSFRLIGEQIDGSFILRDETYLVEARWQGPPIGNRELQSFAGQVRAKSQWSRGLFVSYSGFSPEGLTAFTRGAATPIICMDGFDLSEVLANKRDLVHVLELKARRAAETGLAYVSVRDLFSGR